MGGRSITQDLGSHSDVMSPSCFADLPEPAEGDEQPDPVPLMDRSCNASILEKVLEYLTKHHEFDKTGASQVSQRFSSPQIEFRMP